jgi:hypothetical protein
MIGDVPRLAAHENCDEAVRAFGADPIPVFRPRIFPGPKGVCILCAEDAGYEGGEPAREGARHRLWMCRSGWRYDRSGRDQSR